MTLPSAVRSGVIPYSVVENEQAAVLGRQFAERRQVARLGRDQAHVACDRLEQYRGYLAGESHQHIRHGLNVVKRTKNSVLHGPFSDARAVGCAERGGSRAGLDQEGVDMPMIVAGHLDDLGPAGDATRHPDCRHGRLCPG
jgi:hypothetical protein